MVSQKLRLFPTGLAGKSKTGPLLETMKSPRKRIEVAFSFSKRREREIRNGNGGEGKRKWKMERSHNQSDRDGFESGVTPEATPQESCLCWRRDLCQSLPQFRTSPYHQGSSLFVWLPFFFFVFNFILFFILFTYSDLGFSFLACFCLIYSVFNRFTIHNWTKCSWFLYWNSLIWFFRLCYLIVKLWDSINVTFDN